MILADLIQIRAEEKPDLDVLTFEHLSLDGGATPDEVRTFADLQQNANRIAAGMIARGLMPGGRFAVMLRNHPEFIESMIAASVAGGVFVPIDPRTRGEKLAYMLRNADCGGVVCADYCLAEIEAVRRRAPHLGWIIVVETGAEAPSLSRVRGATPIAEVLSRASETIDVRVDDPQAPLQIMYTSGTTGDPKGIVGVNARFCGAGMLGALFGYRSDDRPYTGLSLTHGNAQAVTLMPSLSMGLRAVVSRRFTKSRLWEVCRAYGCTTFSVLGGMATAIYSEPARSDDADNSVRLIVSGGMPAAIWEAFEKRFNVDVFEFYGAMEGGIAYKPVGRGPVGSFGKPVPINEMRVLDDNDRECPPGVIGEICSRPLDGQEPTVEYFGDVEASKKKTRGGWLRSGDMGHIDENGWFFFDYRKGGGIRRNGDFVNAGFVEKVIAEHAEVADVFVYGVPAASGAPGEKDVVAAVVPVKADNFPVQSVFAACREKLEANFVPAYIQVVGEIPKTPSEKPQERFLLRQFDAAAANVFVEER